MAICKASRRLGGPWPLRYTFDGWPHPDSNGDTYVATANTTLADGEFAVKCSVEYTEGKRQGLTRITVQGRVQYGSMAGTIWIDFPGRDLIVENFTASRS